MDKAKNNNDETMFVSLPLSVIEPNDGQLEGLPANPRSITKEKLDLLKKNIQEYPEMLSLRGLMVYPLRGGALHRCGWKYAVTCATIAWLCRGTMYRYPKGNFHRTTESVFNHRQQRIW